MKLSNSFFITKKNDRKEDDAINLLIKSGIIYKYDNSTYFYLPYGLKLLENIKKIIREEHNKYGLEEVLMPSLINEEVFKKSKRSEEEIFKIKSKEGNNLCLCPTHEELFAILSNLKIKSYKDLHFTLYQISNKYRDENKLSFIRKEEFLMCDSYSFDSTIEGMNISYDNMYHIYNNIFKRLNINYLVCDSNEMIMKGKYSEEFHYVCDKEEDRVVKCEKCTYTSNKDIAECKYDKVKLLPKKEIKKVYSSNIDMLKNKYNIEDENIIKSLIYKIDDKFVLVLVRSIDEVNIYKLSKYYNTTNINLAKKEEILYLGGEINFLGPINTRLQIIADNNIKNISNGVCGSNEKNYYYINVRSDIDFKVNKYLDLRIFSENDMCPICKSKCNIYNTIELANIFKLQTSYSDCFNLKYLDEKNKYNRVYMGSYGIGIERLLLACAYSNKDDKGIVFPIDIAPYKVIILLVNINDRDAYRYASNLHDKLLSLNIETLFDDRKISAGIKFNDADLIGMPVEVIVGYKNSDNIIEIKNRINNELTEVNKSDVINAIREILYIDE